MCTSIKLIGKLRLHMENAVYEYFSCALRLAKSKYYFLRQSPRIDDE